MPRAREAAIVASGDGTVPGRIAGRRYSVRVTTEPPADGVDAAPPPTGTAELQPQSPAPLDTTGGTPPATGPPPTPERKRSRGRTVGTWALIVLACLLALLSVVVVYARNELLNTDTFVATVAPLARDHAIQTAVATKVSDNLLTRTDLNQRIENALPKRAGFLVDPITGAVKSATYDITLKLVQSSQFQTLWDQAVRRSHDQLDNLLLGKKVGAFQSTNGQITVDLSQVETQAKKALAAHGLSVFDKVPEYTGAPFVLFHSEDLAKLQRWIRLLDDLALVLPIVSVLLFALAVVLSRDRRRGLVHAASALAVTMAVLLIGANIGRNQYLSSLSAGQSRPANAAVIDTVDAALLDTVRTVLIVAAVIAVIAFVVGTRTVRRALQGRTAPGWLTGGPVHDTMAAHRKAFMWGVLVIGLVVLVVWNEPTVKVALIVVLVTLFVVLLVGLYTARRTPPTPEGGPSSDHGPGPDPALASGGSAG